MMFLCFLWMAPLLFDGFFRDVLRGITLGPQRPLQKISEACVLRSTPSIFHRHCSQLVDVCFESAESGKRFLVADFGC